MYARKRRTGKVTIKKKIRLSNIMMVLIPILFTTIVLIVCLNTSLGSYWHTFIDMYSDENGVQFAQSIPFYGRKAAGDCGNCHCQRIRDCIAIVYVRNHTDCRIFFPKWHNGGWFLHGR